MCIRKYSTALAAFGLMLVSAAATSVAQQPAGGQPQGNGTAAAQRRQVPIAVIDLGYIIKNHPTMKQEMERIRSEEEAAGAEFEKKRQSILKMMEELRESFTEGTADFQRKEQEIASQDTQFRLDVVRKNKQFQEARAQVFYQVHVQVTNLIQFYCQQMGTFVVMRVSREKLDPKKPETIEMGMGQEVFYFQNMPDVDITQWVLESLNSQQAAANTARTSPAGAPSNK